MARFHAALGRRLDVRLGLPCSHCSFWTIPERMRAGTRAARNQLLKDVMRDYGYLEHMGMGVRQETPSWVHTTNTGSRF